MKTNETMLYLRKDHEFLWQDEIMKIEKGWHSYKEISRKLGYSLDMVEASEKNYGVFAWAPEFANVHATFQYEEKGFEIDGEWWPHTEGYFQAMKAYGTEDWERVKQEIKECSPIDSWSVGQRCKLRPDWEEVKDEVMMTGLREKFKDPMLREILLSTGDLPLVQIKYCNYWGSGRNGKGKNALGVLLQNLREEIKNQKN